MNWVFVLSCQDLSGLGGPMGTETTRTRWTKICSSLITAKSLALNEFATNGGKGGLTWKYRSNNLWHSQDLGHSQYFIKKVPLYE